LLISGAGLKNQGRMARPIVMNTQDELKQAIRDLRNGTFIKLAALALTVDPPILSHKIGGIKRYPPVHNMKLEENEPV
jgi:hypothetical protein